MLKKMSKVATDAAAPSGKHKGRVPLIMDSIVNFNDGGAMLKKMSKVAADVAAPSDKYEGRVPLIMDSTANFHDNGTTDFDSNVKIQCQDAKWQKVIIATNGITVVLFNTQKTGACMGDAPREDGEIDLDSNAKVDHQEGKCHKVAIATSGINGTSPNIEKMDALSGE